MWMIWFVLLWSSVASHAWAQKATSIEYQDVIIHSARTSVHDGTFVNVNQSNSIGFDVQISGTATVKFRVSGAGRFGWNDLTCYPSDSTTGATSATVTGFYQCNVAGGDVASARLDVCTGCTVTVVARTGTAIYGKSSGAGGGGSGDVTDVWGCTSGNCNALTGAAGDSLDAGSADSSKPATRSTSLPGTCSEGQMHQDTDSGGTETYICTAANTWTKLGVDGGGIADGDKGDITVSGGGATWTVDGGSITYSKMQNVSATDRVLGRSSAGAGSAEEIPFLAHARNFSAGTFGDDQVWVADSATAGTPRTLPNCSTVSTDKLLYNSATNTFSCGSDQNSGGTPSVVAPQVVTINAGNSPYTVLSTDYLLVCDTTLAARVINLHAATTKHVLAITNLGANTCTVNRAGSDTIVGDTVVVLAAQYDGVTMIADGSSKWSLH